MPSPRIIISGGGTGGHIFPAVAIADALKKKDPTCEVLFVGAEGKMEMEKVPEAGYNIVGLPVAGFHRRLTLKNLTFPFKLLRSMLKAKSVVKDFKPNVAVGVGGYASGPVLKTAEKNKVKTVLQEQNSFPGVTNRLLAKKAEKICVAYEGMETFFPAEKILLTGNPIREQVIQIANKKEEGKAFFGIASSKPVVLIVGGSLGARSINQSIAADLEVFKTADVEVIWQTGKLFIEEAERKVAELGCTNVHVKPFIKRMDLAYAAADILVSRAGAMAISEISVVGKPNILVPLPSAAGDHQTKNANALAEKGAALLVPDNEAGSLVQVVLKLSQDKEQQMAMSDALKGFAKLGAADVIADEILKLV